MTTTHTHVLRLPRGAVRLDITETPNTVYMCFKGAKLGPEEIPRLVAWAAPIVDAYRDDPRPFEMAGEHVDWTGRVEHVGGQWVSYAERREAVQ